jgi:hypothetical protein
MAEIREVGWLLERHVNGKVMWIGVVDGILDWTDDPSAALRLARRADGDSLSEIVEDTESVTEHVWTGPAHLLPADKELPEVMELMKATLCLYAQVPKEVADDVQAKAVAAVAALRKC